MIKRCEEQGIVTLGVTTTPKAWTQNKRWTANSRFVIPALGLHPELVAERHDEITLLETLMSETRFIGEVGLDGSPKFRSSLALQREIFGRVLRAADRLSGRVLTIHSRGASALAINDIQTNARPNRALCILHWFTGTPAEARKAVASGCWFSINGQMLTSERSRALVQSLPLDRLVTETDSPFTIEGTRKSVPWDVSNTIATLASLRSAPLADIRMALTTNAKRILTFGGWIGSEE
jgi:TatD DNase family protein